MVVNEGRTAQMLVDNVPGAPRKVLFPTSFVVRLDHCASLGDWADSTTTSEGASPGSKGQRPKQIQRPSVDLDHDDRPKATRLFDRDVNVP